MKAFPKVGTCYVCGWGQVFLAEGHISEGLRTQRCLVISGTIEPRFGCRDSWNWGATPKGPWKAHPGQGQGWEGTHGTRPHPRPRRGDRCGRHHRPRWPRCSSFGHGTGSRSCSSASHRPGPLSGQGEAPEGQGCTHKGITRFLHLRPIGAGLRGWGMRPKSQLYHVPAE